MRHVGKGFYDIDFDCILFTKQRGIILVSCLRIKSILSFDTHLKLLCGLLNLRSSDQISTSFFFGLPHVPSSGGNPVRPPVPGTVGQGESNLKP